MKASVMMFVFIVASVGLVSAGPTVKFYPAETNEVANKFIVVLRKGLNLASDSDRLSVKLSNTFGIYPEKQIRIGNFRALIIKTERERVKSLLNEAEIDYIEEDKPVKAIAYNTSTCLDYPVDEFGQWGLTRIDSREAIGLECGMYYPCNYTGNTTYSYSDSDNGTDTYVYVFDTGIYVEHEEFGGRAEHGFVATTIDEEPGDFDGHGTHVAGIAVGERYGVAKAARAVSVKVLDGTGSGSLINVVEGVEWVVNDIQTRQRKGVCNLSLGAPGRSTATEDAIRSAMSEGIPFVIAAGNEAEDAYLGTPSFMGKDSAAITVGGTTALDYLASFSNYGDCVNILAPGLYIKSAGIANDTEYAVMSGTSQASPFVAGVVARLISRELSSLTPWGIKLWLLDIATEDAITLGTLPEFLDTPNKLIHFNCELPYVDLATTPIPTPTSTTVAATISGSDITGGPAYITGLLNIILVSTVIGLLQK